jgi:ferric-dicitrate binding protein FerR (iron transport regulator)
MKNQIWIYVVVGAVALALGFYAGKMAGKKQVETSTGTATTKKVKMTDGTVVEKPLDYVLKAGETLVTD